MRRFLALVSVAIVVILSLSTPIAAAVPTVHPGKGQPEFEKFVFVHYDADFAKKGGRGNGNPKLYSYSGYHWASDTVPYRINLAGTRVAAAEAIVSITASFQSWQDDPGSSITFDYQGETADYSPGVNVSSPDYVNVVGWADLSQSYPDAIAITVIWATRGSKRVVDCDTALNTDAYFAWAQADIIGDPDGAYLAPTSFYDVDVQNIMTHEAGHWLQLNDLYSPAATEETMYGYAADRELKKRSLEEGDLAGARDIY